MKYTILALGILISLNCMAMQNESEIGILILSGKINSQTENLKHKSVVSWDKNQIDFKSKYLHLSDESKNIEIWELQLRLGMVPCAWISSKF